VAEFLATAEEDKLSPMLARKIAKGLYEATELCCRTAHPPPLFAFFVFGTAADVCSSAGSPMEVHLRLQQYKSSTPVTEGLSSSQAHQLKHVRTAGLDALRKAVELRELFFGEEHELSIRLRQEAEAAFRHPGT